MPTYIPFPQFPQFPHQPTSQLYWQNMDAADNLANFRVASFSCYLKPGEENFVQKIGGHIDDPLPAILSQETSFPVTSGRGKASIIKPSQNFKFSHSINSQDNPSNHHLVAASFTPRLDDVQENIVFRVKAPIHDLSAAILSPRTCSTHVERINSSNGEIGVFGADKYFNMRLDHGTKKKNENKNEGVIDIVPELESNLRPVTKSISSESSSWNSKAALLRISSSKVSQTRPRKAIGRRIFATFGCSGPCLEKQAVYVAENQRETARGITANGESKRSEHFAFPILNNSEISQDETIKKEQLEDQENVLEESRRSLEVFGSDRMKNGDIATNLARKLSMLTWDAIPKASNVTTTTVGSTTICDDMTSDASSDLFEIENISGTGYSLLTSAEETTQTHHDNMSAGCMSPQTHEYAPSEASIEWSVVTASAADFSSVISDYDEKNIIGISGDIIHTNSSHRISSKNLVGKEAQKGRPGGLLGCKSQKAVNVAEPVVHKSRVVERY